MAAVTAAQMALMTVTTAVGAFLPLQVEAAAVILGGGIELRRRAGNTMTDHWEARLAAPMEPHRTVAVQQVLLERLEGEEEDRLELVEAAVDGEELPVELT